MNAWLNGCDRFGLVHLIVYIICFQYDDMTTIYGAST